MTTITLPPEIEAPLSEAARKQGTTTERLALESLRKLFAQKEVDAAKKPGETLHDFLAGYVGTVAGSSEALSEDCGKHFTDGLVEKQKAGRL